MDANTLKEQLSTEDVIHFVVEALGSNGNLWDSYGNPIFQTVCHNPPGTGSYKLYYYSDTKTFVCYTECGGGGLDIFALTEKAKGLDFKEAFNFVCRFFGIDTRKKGFEIEQNIQEPIDGDLLKTFEFYDSFNEKQKGKKELPEIPEGFLNFFGNPVTPVEWKREGISPEVLYQFGIRTDGCDKIIIPHRTKDGILRGIRGRTFNPIELANGCKYMPVYVEKTGYGHPLGENLYGLYENQKAIKEVQKIIVYESEKSVLMNNTIYGDLSYAVATCGSNITASQQQLILESGAKELILAYDRENPIKDGSEENFLKIKAYEEKLLKQVQPLANVMNISIVFDYEGVLEPKMSPIDKGQETLEYLLKRKIKIDCIEQQLKGKRK